VAGCYRCVLSYFNQPDHENIDRRNRDAQQILLRLAYSATKEAQTPSENEEPSSSNSTSQDPVSASSEFADFPPMHPSPLRIIDQEISLFWRSKRTVAIEEANFSEALGSALEAKGVTFYVLPVDPGARASVLHDLKSALEE